MIAELIDWAALLGAIAFFGYTGIIIVSGATARCARRWFLGLVVLGLATFLAMTT